MFGSPIISVNDDYEDSSLSWYLLWWWWWLPLNFPKQLQTSTHWWKQEQFVYYSPNTFCKNNFLQFHIAVKNHNICMFFVVILVIIVIIIIITIIIFQPSLSSLVLCLNIPEYFSNLLFLTIMVPVFTQALLL